MALLAFQADHIPCGYAFFRMRNGSQAEFHGFLMGKKNLGGAIIPTRISGFRRIVRITGLASCTLGEGVVGIFGLVYSLAPLNFVVASTAATVG